MNNRALQRADQVERSGGKAGPLLVRAPSSPMRRQAELAAARQGDTATRHQHEMGTGYFDPVPENVPGCVASTKALEGSSEAAQLQVSERLAAAETLIDGDHLLTAPSSGGRR
ncbi:MAG: hypothetical protein HY901_08535 [Deltaproteobacteria bacterium]|nr:hypothetical protein [Deltaproteobacteria bacterium]